MDGYVVTARTADGKARQIRCTAHPSCDWTVAVAAARGDDDPIFLAMHGAHLEDRRTPDRKAGGHMRSRPRR